MPETIYFGTNRNPIPNAESPTAFGHNFSENGRDDLRFGKVTVQDNGDVTELVCLPNAPEEGSKVMLKELKQKMFMQGRPTFVFIHGYNTNWVNACRAAASLKKAYAHKKPNVVMLSWPSDGILGPRNIKEYGNDRDDAEASGPAIKRGLLKLFSFLQNDEAPPCGQQIVLWKHSMGHWAFTNALQSLLQDTPPNKRLPRLFDYIISAAADEDNDAFLNPAKWPRIGELCGQMVMYINRHDKALWGSDWTKGNPVRMGNTGPSKPFEVPENVTVVDVSNLDPILDIVGHGYYDKWQGVIDDVTHVLNGVDPHKIPGRTPVPMKNRYELG